MQKKFTVQIPQIPNFITVGEQKLSIADFSEGELRAIGREWTAELIKAGKKKRATRPRGIPTSSQATLPELPVEVEGAPFSESLHDQAHALEGNA